jgi:acetyl-CoA carboxylase carboxyltransferase component
MCGKAFDPRFIFAWPHAKYAVMGAAQASDVVYNILAKAAKDRPKEELDRLRQQVRENYLAQADIRYAAARGWVDAIIPPHETRATLRRAFTLATRPAPKAAFHTGVIQV